MHGTLHAASDEDSKRGRVGWEMCLWMGSRRRSFFVFSSLFYPLVSGLVLRTDGGILSLSRIGGRWDGSVRCVAI
jgi:hypothetical protein